MCERAKNNRERIIIVVLFLISAALYGVISDFPKVISGYPDELRYVGIGRSLVKGQGLRLHGLDSDFQKILYSICIMPAFRLQSTAQQIRAVGYINSLLMASSVFPVYGLCRKILKADKWVYYFLVFWLTFPAFVYTEYFMSEVIFLPLSLWVIYCVWCIFSAERTAVRLGLNVVLGFLCYLTYLNKEIALYYVIAYISVYSAYCIFSRKDRKNAAVCLTVFLVVFAGCFLLMKGTLFRGLHNSYSDTNLQVLHSHFSVEKAGYLIYGFVYDVVFAVLAFGIFPVLLPAVFFEKREKESWFFLFLLTSFLIGCATIAYMITLPEDFNSRAPRLHMRYLEPLIIPCYIAMADKIRKVFYTNKADTLKSRFRLLGIGVCAFTLLFIGGDGGGSYLADNSTLLYYELFARFLSGSGVRLDLLRVLIGGGVIAGMWVVCKQKHIFFSLFSMLFIGLNIVNSAAGGLAAHYRYGIPEEQRQQAVCANEYLNRIDGNILLVSEGREASPEDKRLFDTYMDRDFYVCDIDSAGMKCLLEDLVIDLAAESIQCDLLHEEYPDLRQVEYLVVRDNYGIRFAENTVEEISDFPLEGYSLYRNVNPEQIYIVSVP